MTIAMTNSYSCPDISIISIETEQCILSGSNAPGFEPGTDLDDLFE